MKKLNFFLCMIFTLLLFPISTFAQTPTVEFKCNMSVQIKRGTFNAATDSVWVRGNFNSWEGREYLLTDADGDSIYSAVFTNFTENQELVFKFVHSPDVWEATANWSLTVTAGANVYECYWENVKVYVPKHTIQVTFSINMELERLKGSFDPTIDHVGVRGSFSGWCGAIVSTSSASDDENFELAKRCETILTQSQTNADLYEGVVPMFAEVGEIVTFKFYYSPGIWEKNNLTDNTQNDRYFVVSQWNLDDGFMSIEANFNNESLETVLNQDANITFTCNTNGASIINAPPGTEFKTIHIAGGHLPLKWPDGGWPDIDSTKMMQLYDDGTHDDVTAEDKIFTTTITFHAYSQLTVAYKFSANWGLPTNGGGNDNEGGIGADKTLKMHKFTTNAVIKDTFGLRRIIPNVEKLENSIPTDFKLNQNYPNPFNPETRISWQLSRKLSGSFVTLKIYDVLGNEIATLVNEEQPAGTYQVTFNPQQTTNHQQLSSGVFFYQLRAGNFVQTKKMILMR
ncbi:MAG: T9SS type A sorting domain-containing protein [Ignavibacteriaceae bacterium]|nr:T9SS type A sorting domain-containing protein [Ignavibacteriaceae bacterium]